MSMQILAGAAFVAGAIPLAWYSVAGSRRTSTPLATLTRGFEDGGDIRRATLDLSARERTLDPAVKALAGRARRLTPAGMLASLERRLATAGMQGVWTIEQVLAAKLGLLLVGVLLGAMYVLGGPSATSVLGAVFAAALGWFAPDVVLHGKADDRRKKVQLELANTIDQITIAVEAGLGFEAAMARVADGNDTVLSNELSRTLQDIRLGVARAEALEGLSSRCELPELRHFVMAIRQAEKFGLPIAHVLRVQSDELRSKRRQVAEEKAMKLPVKVLFPLIFCILPTLFIVMIGPGAINIATGL